MKYILLCLAFAAHFAYAATPVKVKESDPVALGMAAIESNDMQFLLTDGFLDKLTDAQREKLAQCAISRKNQIKENVSRKNRFKIAQKSAATALDILMLYASVVSGRFYVNELMYRLPDLTPFRRVQSVSVGIGTVALSGYALMNLYNRFLAK